MQVFSLHSHKKEKIMPRFFFGLKMSVANFDRTVLHLASPALCGIKPANLFTIESENCVLCQKRINELNKEFFKDGVKLVLLPCKNRFLVFAYSKILLKKTLSSSRTRRYLKSKGYGCDSSEKTLSELFRRLCTRSCKNFPHEIGIFLGYPFEDVVAFEKNCGRGCKYTGSWEVYGDVKSACKKMNEYKMCSEKCCALFDKGFNVVDISRIYKSSKHKEVC